MKKILGLDLGTTSIGWAYVNEAETDDEKSSIVKLGVRVIPISTDEESDFMKGKAISINADRTLKRGARRNLDRFQLRRDALIEKLGEIGFIETYSSDDSKSSDEFNYLNEEGKDTTHSSYAIRAKAVNERITKQEFAKVLLMINKKRGYKSSRKAKSEEEGMAIDGMKIAKYLADNKLTPGQYVYKNLKDGKKYIPDFYRSDLKNELDKIWDFQTQFYPEILNDDLKEKLEGKNKGQTWKICEEPFSIVGVKQLGSATEKKFEKYLWRSDALVKKIELEQLAIILQEINSDINASSGYLGAISDRSKELYFKNQTVGEYLFEQLKQNPHTRLKNQVFYRQDYFDEFEKIWDKQKEFYPELSDDLKHNIRDNIIFYQRPLKSQKHLISNCEFEEHHKAIPKSSPLFQEFKIWLYLNNIEYINLKTRKKSPLRDGEKEFLFNELNIRSKLSSSDIFKLLDLKPKEHELNYKEIEGNRTNAEIYHVYQKILEYEGEDVDFSKMKSEDINYVVNTKFLEIGIDPNLLVFNTDLQGNEFDKQAIIQLWHLLYSSEDEGKLVEKLSNKFGFKKEYARLLANIPLQSDYGSLSSRAIRKIITGLKEGHTYDIACDMAGYNHSSSLTKEELANRELKNTLELLPKNSLRNPVVEKILNQMVNVINAIIKDKSLGKPDEIRIELARELKRNAKERGDMTKRINKVTTDHEKIRKILHNDFGITKVTRNDIIKYKLWVELESNGYKTLYTDTFIRKEELFSKKFDIEHIIPKAKLFDDSFSNKTLSVRQINIDKGNETAYDFLKESLNQADFNQFLSRIERLFKSKNISKAKYNKLKMKLSEIPDGFIDRDLRNSQYIAKKAKQMLEDVVRTVNTTTGSITNRLRSDWQLVNVMKELNMPKYEKLGLVKTIEGKSGRPEKQIIDWTKRNDHRHHAMDALTVAFTSYSHVQYLNNLHAREDKLSKVYGIETKYLHRDNNSKLIFNSPMPLSEFREESKKHLENILVSFKAKNKVVTRNKNRIRVNGKDKLNEKIELTPRGQLHKETVYGKIERYKTKEEKIGTKFNLAKIKQVAKQSFREALLIRLEEFNGDPKKAFGGKNSPSKNPILIKNNDSTLTDSDAITNKLPDKVKLVWKEVEYTIRKDISPELKLDKVIDVGIRNILAERLKKYGGDAKKAFVNLDENPIWLNKQKGISIKRVTISGVSNAEALHYKKDHYGKLILDEDGNKQAVDFVSTGNNHHVAIYRDEKGNLQEEVVSFYEAVHRVNEGLPIINKGNKKGWEFLFTMKQNEYFIFPSDTFDPEEIDLFDPKNAYLISNHLYRVQKISIKNYMFRHHLETNVESKEELKNVAFIHLRNTGAVQNLIKVRINHLGQIIHVGEY